MHIVQLFQYPYKTLQGIHIIFGGFELQFENGIHRSPILDRAFPGRIIPDECVKAVGVNRKLGLAGCYQKNEKGK